MPEKRLTPVARKLRGRSTDAERLLWSRLRSRQLGAKFVRQFPIGPHIVDFACRSLRLAIGLDGASTTKLSTRPEQRSSRPMAIGSSASGTMRFSKIWTASWRQSVSKWRSTDERGSPSPAARAPLPLPAGERDFVISAFDPLRTFGLPLSSTDEHARRFSLANAMVPCPMR